MSQTSKAYELGRSLTFFLQKYTTFGHHDRHIAIDETFTLIIGKRYGDVCISDTVGQRNAKDSRSYSGCKRVSMDARKLVISVHSLRFGRSEETCVAS